MRTRTRDLDPEIFDENGILRDGATYKVPLHLRDSVDRPLTHDELMIKLIEHDAQRRRGLHVDAADPAPFALNKPGFRRLVAADGDRQQQDTLDAARQRVLDARAKYISDLENSWRTPSTPTGEGSKGHEYVQEAGDACSVNGRPGFLVEGDDGELVCQPTDELDRNQPLDGLSLAELQAHRRRVCDAAIQEYESWISNQWRTR